MEKRGKREVESEVKPPHLQAFPAVFRDDNRCPNRVEGLILVHLQTGARKQLDHLREPSQRAAEAFDAKTEEIDDDGRWLVYCVIYICVQLRPARDHVHAVCDSLDLQQQPGGNVLR